MSFVYLWKLEINYREVNIILEYSSWLIVPCVMLGAGYAFLLYYKDAFLADSSPFSRYLMFGIRFVIISFLAILLLSPMVQSILREQEKPILVLLQDNSESIIPPDSTAFVNNYLKSFLNFARPMSCSTMTNSLLPQIWSSRVAAWLPSTRFSRRPSAWWISLAWARPSPRFSGVPAPKRN